MTAIAPGLKTEAVLRVNITGLSEDEVRGVLGDLEDAGYQLNQDYSAGHTLEVESNE
ncbi:hypothetical protein K8O93_00770 [Gordonia bronchialis]|uniref:hypothetical protein n=1 Tax=Gordonia bronchialis TaxID=2054 RepID=UPI001CC03B00|nr:hypothetical protein [Gordonia bronchialis]UAK38366.1 hypothetical protein K8O93_00770 [Gordonia bronchialis]